MNKIKHIPGVIIQGRYDMICRTENAYKLHNAWPASKLILTNEGHASSEPNILQALLEAANTIRHFF